MIDNLHLQKYPNLTNWLKFFSSINYRLYVNTNLQNQYSWLIKSVRVYFFVFWCKNLMILTFISPLMKPFIYWSLFLQTVANKNRFSLLVMVQYFCCSAFAALQHTPIQLNVGEHTRLQAYASHRQASAQLNCNISSPGLNDSFYARWDCKQINYS